MVRGVFRGRGVTHQRGRGGPAGGPTTKQKCSFGTKCQRRHLKDHMETYDHDPIEQSEVQSERTIEQSEVQSERTMEQSEVQSERTMEQSEVQSERTIEQSTKSTKDISVKGKKKQKNKDMDKKHKKLNLNFKYLFLNKTYNTLNIRLLHYT